VLKKFTNVPVKIDFLSCFEYLIIFSLTAALKRSEFNLHLVATP